MRLFHVCSSSLVFTAASLEFGPGPLKSLAENSIRSVRGARLRQAAKQRTSVKPESLDPDQVRKMEVCGFEWDEAESVWKHVGRIARSNTEDASRRTWVVDEGFDEEEIYESMVQVFDNVLDEAEQARYAVSKRAKFTPRPLPRESADDDGLPSSTSEEQREALARLGFSFNPISGKWRRGAARQTVRTLEVTIPGGQRMMRVKAKSEADIMAVNRLEYVLSRANIDSPENVADGAYRYAREPTFFFVWAVAQFLFYQEWASYKALGADSAFAATATTPGFFVNVPATVDAALQQLTDAAQQEPLLLAMLAAFVATHVASRKMWLHSSGSRTLDGYEKALADAIVGDAAKAPYDWQWREQRGFYWRFLAGALSVAAAVPRAQMVHGYLQSKFTAMAYSSTSLEAMLDPSSQSTSAAFSAVVGVALVTALYESFALRWARPPITSDDELDAIRSSLEEDKLAVRLATDAAVAVEKNNRKTKGIFTAESAAAFQRNTEKNAEAFDKVATAWCDSFHNGKRKPSAVTKDLFGLVVAILAGARAAAAAAAYTLAGDAITAPVALHAAAATLDLGPTPKQEPHSAEVVLAED